MSNLIKVGWDKVFRVGRKTEAWLDNTDEKNTKSWEYPSNGLSNNRRNWENPSKEEIWG